MYRRYVMDAIGIAMGILLVIGGVISALIAG